MYTQGQIVQFKTMISEGLQALIRPDRFFGGMKPSGLPPWRTPPSRVMAMVDTYEAECRADPPLDRQRTGPLMGLPDHLLLHVMQSANACGVFSAATACRSLQRMSRDSSLWTCERLNSWSDIDLGKLPLDIQAQPTVRASRFLARARAAVAQPQRLKHDLSCMWTHPFENYASLPDAAKATVDEAYDILARCRVQHIWFGDGSEFAKLRRIWPHAAILKRETDMFLARRTGALRVSITSDNFSRVLAGFLRHDPVANNAGNYRVSFWNPHVVVQALTYLAASANHAGVRDKVIFIARCPVSGGYGRELRSLLSRHPHVKIYVETCDRFIKPFT